MLEREAGPCTCDHPQRQRRRWRRAQVAPAETSPHRDYQIRGLFLLLSVGSAVAHGSPQAHQHPSDRDTENWGDSLEEALGNVSTRDAHVDPRENSQMLQLLGKRGDIMLSASLGAEGEWRKNKGKPVGPPPQSFNSRRQNILSAVKFAWWCNNTWRCWHNFDNSITLSTFWKDQASGWKSKWNLYYGKISVEMKLPKVNSDGVWHTFYVIQPQDIPNNDSRHAEIDIEFYGNKDPRKIKIATNIIAGGYQMLEQHYLSFDPSKEFHKYTIQWGPSQIVWFVDSTPIRVTKREKGRPWPAKPLEVLGTTWATRTKVDWREGPMSVQYRNLEYQSCATWRIAPPLPSCSNNVNSKKHPWNAELTPRQKQMMRFYRKNYLVNSWGWDKW